METVKSSSEISQIFNEGQRAGTPELTLIVRRFDEQRDRQGRVAFIAGKKLGNAVWRNRAKRRMRALCQQLGGPVPQCDLVFLARKKVTEAPFDSMLRHTQHAMTKLGLEYE